MWLMRYLPLNRGFAPLISTWESTLSLGLPKHLPSAWRLASFDRSITDSAISFASLSASTSPVRTRTDEPAYEPFAVWTAESLRPLNDVTLDSTTVFRFTSQPLTVASFK